jgi:hypothetical protein
MRGQLPRFEPRDVHQSKSDHGLAANVDEDEDWPVIDGPTASHDLIALTRNDAPSFVEDLEFRRESCDKPEWEENIDPTIAGIQPGVTLIVGIAAEDGVEADT